MMSRHKDMFLIIDVETANGLDDPLPYDIGYAICDRNGKIFIQRSYVVSEIFLGFPHMMRTAYYNEKIPNYWKDIQTGKRCLQSIFYIRKQILTDMKKYNVKKVGAYNMRFDRQALNNVIRYCSKSFIRWFFPFGTEYFCIWSMACQVILNTTGYVKFALNNNYLTNNGNIQTTAEMCYRYLNKKLDFNESHTGLEDVKIEIEIMVKCFKTHKKMNKSINPLCWQIPQAKRKIIQNKMAHPL